VRGISGLTCPECGRDLREVGIVTPNARAPLPAWVWALGWTLAVALTAVPISMLLLATILPFAVKHKSTREIVCQTPYLNLTLDLDAEGWAPQPAIMRSAAYQPDRFTLSNRSYTMFLEAYVGSGAYHYWSSGAVFISRPSGFSGAAIANWLAPAGVNTADPRVRTVCDQIFKLIMQMHQGPASAPLPILDAGGNQVGIAKAATSWVVHDEPHPLVIAALGLFWLIVYLCGLVILFRRRRATASPPVSKL
jgi:hypothetical protein